MMNWELLKVAWKYRSVCVVAALVLLAGTAQAAVTDGLELYSPMDGATPYLRATYWQDATGNGYDGKQNIEAYDGGGARSTAADFDGTSNRLRVWDGMDPALDPGTGDYSVSLWYYETSYQGYTYLLTKGNNHGSSWSGYSIASVDGVPRIRMNDVSEAGSGPPKLSVVGPSALAAGAWHHLVAVFDRTGVNGPANTVSLYIDGDTANPATGTVDDWDGRPYDLSPKDPSLTNEYELCVGGRSRYSSNDMEGYMDDVAVYRGALSPADVATLHNATSLNVDTITTAGITPVAIHNFETNLNQPEAPGVVPDAWDGNPGQAWYEVQTVYDPVRGSDVIDVDPTSHASGVNYGDILAPGSDSYTTSIWFKLENTGSEQMIVVKSNNRSSSNEGYSITAVHDAETGNPTISLRACYEHDNSDARLGLKKTATYDEWHHVAMVFDRETGLLKGYLDGEGSGASGSENDWELTYGNVIPEGVDFVPTYDEELRLGIRYNGSYRFSGQMDDFAVWSRALTDGEILGIAQGTIAIPEPSSVILLVLGLFSLASIRRR